MPKQNLLPDELEAFCHCCPEPEEVIMFLTELGLRWSFTRRLHMLKSPQMGRIWFGYPKELPVSLLWTLKLPNP